MKQEFDITKPVKARDGRAARIICDNRVCATGLSLVSIIAPSGENTDEGVFYHYPNGRYYTDAMGESPSDLINIPVKRKGWAVVHDANCNVNFRVGSLCKTYEDALERGKKYNTTIAIIPIEFEEGEGLDE